MPSKAKQTETELEITVANETISVGKEFDEDSEIEVPFETLTEEEATFGKRKLILFAHPSGLFGLRFKNGGIVPDELSGVWTGIKFAEEGIRGYLSLNKSKETKVNG